MQGSVDLVLRKRCNRTIKRRKLSAHVAATANASAGCLLKETDLQRMAEMELIAQFLALQDQIDSEHARAGGSANPAEIDAKAVRSTISHRCRHKEAHECR